jgi:hypothetical protein
MALMLQPPLPITREITDEGTITFLDRAEGQLRVTSFQPSSFRPPFVPPEGAGAPDLAPAPGLE